MKNTRLTQLAAAMLLGGASVASAGTTITLDASADSYFKYADGTGVTHGQETELIIKTDALGKSNTRKGYIRFDLGGITVADIQSATLKLTVTQQKVSNLKVYGYKDATAASTTGDGLKNLLGDADWNDGRGASTDDLEYLTAPASWYNSGTYFGADFYLPYTHGGAALGTLDTDVTVGTVLELTGSNLLGFLQADTNGQATFMLSLENNQFFKLASSEHGTYTGPQLVIESAGGDTDSTIRIVDTSFDSATRTFSLTWESSDTATYTLWESPDLSAGSWTELDNAIPGDAGATTTYPVSGLSVGQTEHFYRVSENP